MRPNGALITIIACSTHIELLIVPKSDCIQYGASNPLPTYHFGFDPARMSRCKKRNFQEADNTLAHLANTVTHGCGLFMIQCDKR